MVLKRPGWPHQVHGDPMRTTPPCPHLPSDVTSPAELPALTRTCAEEKEQAYCDSLEKKRWDGRTLFWITGSM